MRADIFLYIAVNFLLTTHQGVVRYGQTNKLIPVRAGEGVEEMDKKLFKRFVPSGGKQVFISLVDGEDGEALIVAVDENGEQYTCGNIALFGVDGRLHLCAGVNESLGFALDPCGRIVTEKS